MSPLWNGLKKLRHTHPYCSAIIVAAGSASRMRGVDKITAELAGHPVIYYTLRAFEDCPLVDEVVVVTRSDLIAPIGDICKAYGLTKPAKIVVGGADRSHSVKNGLGECSSKAKLIAIHDGARPFVSQRILKETIEAAAASGAAAPAIPVTDTIKTAVEGVVTGTPDRSTLFGVQTPQVFDGDLIRGALHHCIEHHIPLTDDCSAVEQLGKKVVLTKGERTNLKITTQLDLLVGEVILCQDAI